MLPCTAIVLFQLLPIGPLSVHADRSKQWLESNLPLTEELISSISNTNEVAANILRLFGLASEPKLPEIIRTATNPSAATSHNGIKISDRKVCPFDADPLISSGEYSYCTETIVGDCPAGFVCDLSLALGRTICCQDLRAHPVIRIKIKKPTTTTFSPTQVKTNTHEPEPTWSTTITNRRSPWYIRGRKPLYGTAWNGSSKGLPSSRMTNAPITPIGKFLPTESTVATDRNEQSAEDVASKVSSATLRREITDHNESKFVFPTKFRQTTSAPSALPTSSLPAEQLITSVTLIQIGDIKRLTNSQTHIVGTIALINDQGYRILVDTGSAADTETLLEGLSSERTSVNDIAVVVRTSGHPSYTGNFNLFPLKPILSHTMEYVGRHAIVTELKNRPYRKLTENVEVWKTPGPTQESLSVLVYNVEGNGTVAIVGDLIATENYMFNRTDSRADLDGNVWDALIKRQNSNLIVCLADWIIPGHGKPFPVLPLYRQRAGCTRLLAQEKFRKM